MESTIKVEVNDLPPASQHHTLKYQLLGPSLTKAGQDAVDQQRVSEIIYEASKGSKFFNNEENRDKNLTTKIQRILARKAQLEKLDLNSDRRRADDYIAELELSRDLSQTIVHVDCDAFYAAVEELDQPELKNVPFAVGKGVLTTCNYHARKFGCRSGMAGFVAMKLCPQLICLPLNFEKYTSKAREVREILAEYDENFESASIDEAYLNVTAYCEKMNMPPDEAVAQLRREVSEKTKITISAGIAANAKLAKICSNKNKPNGQFLLPNDRNAIMSFMRDLPARKVNGVGRVFERELAAVGISTCGQIFAERMYLSKLFGEKAYQFLIQCYLGLGRTKVQPAEDYTRKSIGTESTFHDMNDKEELKAKLRHTAEELEKDMKRVQFKGKTLVLKVKLHTYEVFTRQIVPPKAVCLADDLYNYSLPMLVKLWTEFPNFKLRLMGLRCTHLVSMQNPGQEFFGKVRRSAGQINQNIKDDGEWETWPDEEFEQAAQQEKDDEMAEIEKLSQDMITAEDGDNPDDTSPRRLHARMVEPNPKKSTVAVPPQTWDCPICGVAQEASDKEFNEHIDHCLSRSTIRDAVKQAQETTRLAATEPKAVPAVRKKRDLTDIFRREKSDGQEIPKKPRLAFSSSR